MQNLGHFSKIACLSTLFIILQTKRIRKMRKILIPFFAFGFILSACGGASNSSSSGQVELKEEMPPAITVESNMGNLTMNKNGVSVEKKNEMTELLRLLSNDTVDIAEVVWVWKSKGYPDMPMKMTYNKRTNSLKQIYTQNNVIEEYKNVDYNCLLDFLKSGTKEIHKVESYCKASYDFNNREMKSKVVGPKPEQSEWDGEVKIVRDYVKSIANDPSSIKFIEWSKVSEVGENWFVRAKFTGKNALGGTVTTNMGFFIQNNKVVRTTEMK